MKNNKKLSVILLVIFLVIGCFLINYLLKKEHTTKIGVGAILPLTGEYAQYGNSVKNGIMLAFEKFKDSLQKNNIELVIEDDKGDVKTSLNAFNKLISTDKLKFVIGAVPSGITLSLAPVAEKEHVLLLSPTSTATAVKNAGDYVFRVCVSDEFEGKAMADYVIANLKGKRIGTLNINNDYGNGLKSDFEKYLQNSSVPVNLSMAYLPDTRNFKTILSKFKEEKIEIIYLVAQKEQSLIFKQLKEINYTPQVTGSTMIEDPDLIKSVGNNADGTIYTFRSYNADDNSEIVKDFVNSFKIKFGSTPDFYAASGYDAARVAIHVMRNSKYEVNDMKNKLYSLKQFPGVTGKITFDKNGDVTQPFGLKIIKNQEFKFINH